MAGYAVKKIIYNFTSYPILDCCVSVYLAVLLSLVSFKRIEPVNVQLSTPKGALHSSSDI